MNPPVQLLLLGSSAPDLATSAYGPFVVETVARLDDVSAELDQQRYDAIVLQLPSTASLAAWTGLARAVLESAVVVVVPEPEAVDALRLLRLGVQDVLPQRELVGVGALARVLRLAVERKRLERGARKAYATDLATGLPNHAQFMEHMTHLLALREREPAAMALLAVSIDGLAATEARLGAEAANVLRRKVAVRLRSGLRASDVVAAIGVDSFAVMLAWIDDPEDSNRVAAKLAASLQRPFSVTGQDVAVAVRLGVARYPDQGKDADSLLRLALGQAGDVNALGRVGLAPRGGSPAANDE
ncbi:GGDEF domain-containing protein [Ideonella sp. A 288]|uniref:GGDEF domain-containing protein n=1 Tax=Ideonella sp. A 288 TaxID=1962181 RepID=UPI00118633F9|nr:GGDEF domain-containing protein [Ideonella sp. A 288]